MERSFMKHKRKFGEGNGPRKTPKESLAGQFLIDTLPIRVTRKPCDCIVGAHSNRHSSEARNWHFPIVALVFRPAAWVASNCAAAARRCISTSSELLPGSTFVLNGG